MLSSPTGTLKKATSSHPRRSAECKNILPIVRIAYDSADLVVISTFFYLQNIRDYTQKNIYSGQEHDENIYSMIHMNAEFPPNAQ